MHKQKKNRGLGVLLAAFLTAAAIGCLLPTGASALEEFPEVTSYRAQDRLKGPAACMAQGGDSGEIGGEGSGLLNILLIGQDHTEGVAGSRSDSMILCTFRPGDKTAVLTSFLRDLYVSIPDHGKNRINAAYALGGPELLCRTLKENFGIVIDGTVEVDFNQFPQVIDILGGVTLEVRPDEAKEINRLVKWQHVEPGTVTLSGDQTLVYARIRRLDADSDISRTLRQRKVLEALKDQYENASVGTLLNLMRQLLPMVTTDIGYLEILSYARMVLPMIGELKVVSQRVPMEPDYQDTRINGMSVLVPDLPRTRARLQSTLRQAGPASNS